MPDDAAIDEVLGFWLEPKPLTEEGLQQRGRLWFAGGPELDREIKERFGALVERARAGELDAWTKSLRGTLALVILLDQFPRNVYRGTPAAFESDARAVELVQAGFDAGQFATADGLELMFLTLPFSHAEDLALQRRSCAIAVRTALAARPEWKKTLVGAFDFSRKHLDVIARFGRFPHRNAVLGRAPTPEELEYLEFLRAAGQWL
jgi:uncharacterized protein (DUF924 family)